MRWIAFILALVLASPLSLRGQDGANQESLKSVHGLLTQAVASGNVSMIGNLVHPQALGFFRDSQQLVQLRSGYGPADVVPAVVADLSQFSSVPYDSVFRVAGDVGIVCQTSNSQPKDSRVKPRYLRSTYVYTLVQGNWKLLSWHTSDTPLGK
ncbi:MAG: nuclear transport factor 2 family protein [Acidobacteriota bacterium]|nr:nuclear transport factor 2 family protein [Acidobacteriota bacterium]